MDRIQVLKNECDNAWEEYSRLNKPAQVAYKKYEEAQEAYNEALMYEKARKNVIRDLLKGAEINGEAK